MNDIIKITDDELNRVPEQKRRSAAEKIILCELPAEASAQKTSKEIPWFCYCVLLLPVLNLPAVVWAFMQTKYHFRFAVPAVCTALLFSMLPAIFLLSGNGPDTNWKNTLAQKAKTGVVIILTEEKGFFTDSQSLGTGVVIAKKGGDSLILTNRHVVSPSNDKPADSIRIMTSDKKTYSCSLAALPAGPNVDMALLLVRNSAKLNVLGTVADYKSLKTGDEVVAIGHPSGFAFTMTDGIVSALRDNMLIQSTACINPGNSGGPLLDSSGRVIGINTFTIKNTQGLNFAFRADFVLDRSAWKYFLDISSFLSEITVK